MKIVYSKELKKDFIERILYIDSQVYSSNLCGTYETVNSRYQKNKDSYLLLYHANEIIGYMCFFPIKNELYQNIICSDHIYDNDITPDQICSEYTTECSKIFIISIVILPEYQNTKGVILLSNAFDMYMNTKNKNKKKVSEIVAIAVSDDGNKILNRLSFQIIKQLENNSSLFIRKEN